MKFSKLSSIAIAMTLALGSGAAMAQDKPSSSSHETSHKPMAHDQMMASMPSMHEMPATVTAVDTKTGVVDVTSEGMSLKLHFPASSVASLKAGDKINLHLGFSKE
jgi:hypothetical protein